MNSTKHPSNGQGLQEFLQWIVKDEERETLWLDLLSQLEYVGCRKILKSVPYERVDAKTLQHVHEEALHAYLLKALVRKRGRDGASWDSSPLSPLGWKYFQTLDQQVSALGDEPSYPLVSWAIEARVLQVYPQYLATTRDPEVARTLKRILAQEKRHGEQFDQQVVALKKQAAAIEERCWQAFLEGLSQYWKRDERIPRRPAQEGPALHT